MDLKLANTLLKHYCSQGPEEIRRLKTEGKITLYDFLLMLPVGLLPYLGCIFADEAGICKFGGSGSFENRGIKFFVDLSGGFAISTTNTNTTNANTNFSATKIRTRTFSCWTTKDSAHYEFNGRQLTLKETHLPLISVLCLSN